MTQKRIIAWAEDRGIFEYSEPQAQFLKLAEEMGELSDAMQKHNKDKVKDAIGDMVVVLTILAHMYGMTLDECLDYAYEQIKNRQGKISNGVFIKSTSRELA